MASQWGWAGSATDFTHEPAGEVLGALTSHHMGSSGESPSASQISAWRDELKALTVALDEIGGIEPDSGDWNLVFEYELPREGGRRPDVVLLARGCILVMEFKGNPRIDRAYIDQVDAYARDLSEYHSASRDHQVIPMLVMPNGNASGDFYGVRVATPADLASTIRRAIAENSSSDEISLEIWLSGDYAPLPTLVRAARTIFSHEALPQIRRAESSGVDEAVGYLRDVAQQASCDGGMHLALVAGVPGAGKTLVGLRFVYETHFESEEAQDAVFLSGNGPLVQVLQHTLSKEGREGRTFVRDVHAFLKSYGGSSSRRPIEHIWVYDEAQRAWDQDKVREKRPTGYSEPEDFLRVGEKLGGWALMVGLIGEGQEIHVGEESGLVQWNDAIASVAEPWVVHCPARVRSVFSAAYDLRVEDSLDLSFTLRSHKADRLHDWVDALLEHEHVAEARRLAEELKLVAFSPLVTRDAEAAKSYARLRYADAPEARFGLMMSSQRKWSAAVGFRDDFYLKPGPWFGDDETSPFSCRQMAVAITEFQCQGLELDLPIVGWGGDLLWMNGWEIPFGVRKRLQHPAQITKNVYRVLLTRGRDGFVVVVPPRNELDGVFETLLAAGCDRLESVDL
jgi:hypothetical protein